MKALTAIALLVPSVRGLAQGDAGTAYQLVTAGSGFTCALTTTGKAHCWGSNEFGILGAGEHREPVPVPLAAAHRNPVPVEVDVLHAQPPEVEDAKADP